MTRVILYERVGCGLCRETREALRRLGAAVERIDIDGDPALVDRYTLRVPVLRAGDAELDAAGLEDGAVRRWLQANTGV